MGKKKETKAAAKKPVPKVNRSSIAKPAATSAKAATRSRVSAPKKAPAKKVAARKAPAKKVVAKKAPAKKVLPAKRSSARRGEAAKKPADAKVQDPAAGLAAVVATPKGAKGQKKEKKAPENTVKGYTKEQLEKFKELKNELKNKNNQELKDLLRKNDQSMSGNKDELIEKVADGVVLGKIPRCASCFGGRLRFNYKTGEYNCPGYRDDVDYHNCNKKFSLSEVTRDPWTS